MPPTGYARAMRLPEMYGCNPDAHQNGNSGCQRSTAQLMHNVPPPVRRWRAFAAEWCEGGHGAPTPMPDH
jgi:hypothetical protein